MADSKNYGILSQYGLDLGAEDDVRSALRQKRIADAMRFVSPNATYGVGQNAQRTDSRNQSFGYLGAAIGNAIGEKFDPKYADLPPEIASRLSTVKGTKEDYDKWLKAHPEASMDDRSSKYQRILAEKAFANDLPEVGIGLLRDIQDRTDMTDKRNLELAKLNYEVDTERQTHDSNIATTLAKNRKEGMVTIYPFGSSNPNTGMPGYLRENGEVVTGKGIVPPDQYTFDRPQRPPTTGGSGGGRTGGITPSEAGRMRDRVSAAMRFHRGVLEAMDILDRAVDPKVGPFTGQIGKLSSMANQVVTLADQLAESFSPTGTVTSELRMADGSRKSLSSKNDRAQFIADNEKELKKLLPANLRDKAQVSDQYLALMVELAYAKAMSHEGGSTRSLSDNDFKLAMQTIGANLNSPDTILKILFADSERANSALMDALSLYTPEDQASIVSPEGLKRYVDTYGELSQRVQQAADKAATPAPAAPSGPPQTGEVVYTRDASGKLVKTIAK